MPKYSPGTPKINRATSSDRVNWSLMYFREELVHFSGRCHSPVAATTAEITASVVGTCSPDNLDFCCGDFPSPFFYVFPRGRWMDGRRRGSCSHLDRRLFHSIVSFLTAWSGNFLCCWNTLWRSCSSTTRKQVGEIVQLDFYAALICWLITSTIHIQIQLYTYFIYMVITSRICDCLVQLNTSWVDFLKNQTIWKQTKYFFHCNLLLVLLPTQDWNHIACFCTQALTLNPLFIHSTVTLGLVAIAALSGAVCQCAPNTPHDTGLIISVLLWRNQKHLSRKSSKSRIKVYIICF